MSQSDQRPQIDYPCPWTYRLIGPSEEGIRACVEEILDGEAYELKASKSSRTGRFVSMTLTIIVLDEEQRLGVYRRLAEHDAIRLVL